MLKYSQIRLGGAYLAVSLGLMAIALAVIPLPTMGFELPKYVALAVSASICSVVFVLRRKALLEPLMQSWQGKLYLGFMAMVLLSTLWSVAPVASIVGVAPRFQGLLTFMCCFTLGMAAAHMVGSSRGRSMIVYALLCSNVSVMLYGILQMLQLDPLGEYWLSEAFLGRVFSTLGHPNMLGQFIVLTLPFVGLSLISTSERVVRLWWLAVVTLNLVVLFGTVSRSAMLGAFALVILTAPKLKEWLRKQRNSIKTEQAFALSFVVVLCTSIGLLFFAQRFNQSFESGRSSSAREVIWSGMGDMLWHRPFGWGLDTLAVTSPRFIGKEIYAYEALTTVIDRAHNELLQVALTTGLLGLVVYVFLVGGVLYAVWQQGEDDRTGLLRTAGAGILAYQVALLFGFGSVATLAFFWVLMGMCIGLIEGKYKPVPSWVDALVTWLIAAMSVLALVVSLQWMQARWVHGYARALGNEDPALGLAVHQEGLLTFRFDRESIIETAQAHLIALEQDPENEDLTTSIKAMVMLLENATAHQDGMAHVLSAWLAAIQGDTETVHVQLQQAKQYYKASMVFHRAAAHILELIGDGVGVYEQETFMRGLLPDGYFVEGSELRRILRKQHPWLEKL